MTTLSVTPRPYGRAAELARMLGNETIKGLLILWSHKITLIPQVVMLAVMYLLFQFVLGGGRLVDELLPVTLLAYSIYVVTYIALLKTVAGIGEEANAGTLEQVHLSPLRPWQLSIGRIVAVLVEGVLTAAFVGVGFAVLLGVDLPLRPAALAPLALTLVDIAGFALLLGGLALVVNSIGAIVHVINSMVMMVNGAVVPISAYPYGLEVVARFVPTTLGIDVIRQILLEGQTLAATWANGSLPWTLLHAGVMLTAGWIVYQAAVNRGLRDGRLGP